jgi:hypothetical protein
MRTLFFAILFLLLLACRPLPSLLLLLDPYTAQLLATEGQAEPALRRELRSDFRLRVQTLNAPAEPGAAAAVLASEAERLIRAASPSWVFLGPLLPLDAEALAARLPEVRFLSEQAGATGAPNLYRLRFRREEAFHDAGIIAARLLTRPSLRPVLGERTARGAVKAGLLQAVPTPQGTLEAEAFREGFLAEAGAGLLMERTIGSLTDTGQARRVLEEMREDGVVFFALKTYSLSGFCLEFLRTQGGVAFLEEGAGRRAYPEQVVLWLEEDLAGALRRLSSTPAGQLVSGPVRLHAGAALRSAGARSELGFPGLAE